MKLPAALTENPQLLLRKLLRVGVYLVGLIGILMVVKYNHDQEEKKQREYDERQKMLAETQKVKEEVNWEDRLKVIVPDQEDLLTPNVVPQLLIPPLLNKIDVPKALVYERTKRYTAAYEFRKTSAISFWNASASAAGPDLSTNLSIEMPAMSKPATTESSAPRQPKPPRGVGQTYIILP